MPSTCPVSLIQLNGIFFNDYAINYPNNDGRKKRCLGLN